MSRQEKNNQANSKMHDIEGADRLNLFRWNKLPVILQAEAAECGMACLAMVAGHYGYQTSLTELRRKFSVSLKGVNLRSLSIAADMIGLSARGLRCDLEDLRKLKTPCILHWGLNHFVVLKKAGRKSVVIHDPARGKRSLLMAEVSKHFTGVALELTPTPDFEKKEEKERVRIMDLWSKMTGFIPVILQIIAITVILQVFAVLAPLVNQLVVDEAIAKGDIDFLKVIILGFALLLFVQTAIGVLRSYITMYFGTLLNFQMRSNMLRHILRLESEFFERSTKLGDLLGEAFAELQTEFGALIAGYHGLGLMRCLEFQLPIYGAVFAEWWRADEKILTAAMGHIPQFVRISPPFVCEDADIESLKVSCRNVLLKMSKMSPQEMFQDFSEVLAKVQRAMAEPLVDQSGAVV